MGSVVGRRSGSGGLRERRGLLLLVSKIDFEERGQVVSLCRIAAVSYLYARILPQTIEWDRQE
jgi:hypothetical protein